MDNNQLIELGSDFEQKYSQFYQGESVTDYVTQAYWQCMHLSKKRLDKKHISLDLLIEKKGLTKKKVEDEGSQSVGYFRCSVKAEKTYRMRDKILSRIKSDMVSRCNVIATDTSVDEIICPNCGGTGTMESYIDGCDYCGSKFKLEDFKEKVSSYLLEEDTEGISRKNVKGTLLTFGIGLILMLCIFVVSIILVIMAMTHNAMYMQEAIGVIGVVTVMSIFEPFLWCMLFFTIIMICIMAIYANLDKTRVVSVVPTDEIWIGGKVFAKEQFAEDAETIIRTIHFAESEDEINAFSHINLSPLLKFYQNILECQLNRIMILNYRVIDMVQYFDIKCTLNTTRLKRHKANEQQETVYITLSRRKDIRQANLGLMHFYPCPNCGASIDIMAGGICHHCGTKTDMTHYGWMVETYHSGLLSGDDFGNEQHKLSFSKIQNSVRIGTTLRGLVIIGYLIVAFVCGYYITHNDMLDISNLAYMDEAKADIARYFEKVPHPGDICQGLTLSASDAGINERTYVYTCKGNPYLQEEAYVEGLLQAGYTLTTDEDGNPVYIKSNGGFAGNTYVSISTADHEMIVDMRIDDMDEDAWLDYIIENQ